MSRLNRSFDITQHGIPRSSYTPKKSVQFTVPIRPTATTSKKAYVDSVLSSFTDSYSTNRSPNRSPSKRDGSTADNFSTSLNYMKNTLETTHQLELERLRDRYQEAEKKNSALEGESYRLRDEAEYWRQKFLQNGREREVESEMRDQMRTSQMDAIKKTSNSQMDVLEAEIHRLRTQLEQRELDLEEWKTRYTRLEVRSLVVKGSDDRVRDLESRIDILSQDLRNKVEEMDSLKLKNSNTRDQTRRGGSV